MTTRSTLTLRGDRNQCPGCGEHFNSTSAFEMHRAGNHAHIEGGRYCLTPDQMREKGMVQIPGTVWWVTKLRERA